MKGYRSSRLLHYVFFFFNDTATTEIYTLSLHDALPIFDEVPPLGPRAVVVADALVAEQLAEDEPRVRAPDRKSTRLNLQSRQYLVCRLLLEKKIMMLFDVFVHADDDSYLNYITLPSRFR